MKGYSFKQLEVWHKAADFSVNVIKLSEQFQSGREHYRLVEQIESASASVAMNIAEGKGRYSQKEYVHFLYIARGSLYETITILNIVHKLGWLKKDLLDDIEKEAFAINRMLNSLIRSIRRSMEE